ncbi:Amino acid/polyamine transporter [Phytophthora megakarya]|uniref:Amino acid/polyamine transporter n=1 Tax=Phytophthora megakarya TaxID=4795 RepID=A0A225W8N9_9STRA|nr:Amino acid/polyamine transporter [Phytophthora megakarya]
MSESVNGSVENHRYAKALHLWALGVGAVVSGDFFGWQSGLVAGFDGLLIILAFVTVLFVMLSFSIAELSTTVPSGGGPYVFALHAIGPRAAFFAGLAETLKVVITCAVIVTGISSYLNQLLSLSSEYGPIWWAIFYVMFVSLNIVGIEMTFRVQAFTTVVSVLILLVFYVGAATQISYTEWVANVDWQYPGGWDGAVKGYSFALWFYLGIEELPLAVEVTINPERNMPIGLVTSISTLAVLAFCTVIFNSMIYPGAEEMYNSSSPLLTGYQSVFGDNSTTSGFSWMLILGLIASFHSFIFCMGQLLYAIARDGYLPQILTRLHPTRGTMYVSLIAGSLAGFLVVLVLHYIIGDTRLGSVLINLALIGAVTSYTFQLASFIRLRVKEPNRPRPYRSPFGVPGAIVSMVLCVAGMVSIIYSGTSSYEFLASIIVAILYFGVGATYFFVRVQPRLDKAPTPKLRENLLSNASSKV